MPTPPFILDLREVWGHRPLFLIGVVGVITDSDDRILLVRRSDNGRWSLPAGILEPGEQPADALRRELVEETGIDAHLDRLALVRTDDEFGYPNGDRVQFLTLAFRGHHRSGEAHPADEESTEVGWFDHGDLPELEPEQHLRITAALRDVETTAFAQQP